MAPPDSGTWSAFWSNANRGKQSVVLDIKQPASAAALRGLLASADVFVTNVRPRALAAQGFDYASIAAEFPPASDLPPDMEQAQWGGVGCYAAIGACTCDMPSHMTVDSNVVYKYLTE